MDRFPFLISKSFWVIVAAVTAVHLVVLFYVVGPMKFTDYAAYMFYEVLPRTFAVSREGGEDGEPGMTVYTVPSDLRDLGSAEGSAPAGPEDENALAAEPPPVPIPPEVPPTEPAPTAEAAPAP
ncbi:MAG: hypothetical protein AAGK14_10320 [Verrucomicrobiota bacterium]